MIPQTPTERQTETRHRTDANLPEKGLDARAVVIPGHLSEPSITQEPLRRITHLGDSDTSQMADFSVSLTDGVKGHYQA